MAPNLLTDAERDAELIVAPAPLTRPHYFLFLPIAIPP